ncbi:MAG: NADH-quinone oxidoreductase subunit L, partial [Tepidisphaerales bacterium]
TVRNADPTDMDHWVIEHSYLIPLLPLLGAMAAGFLGAKWLKGQSHWPIWLTVGASAVLSIGLLVGMVKQTPKGSIYKTGVESQDRGHDAAAAPESADTLGKHFQLSRSRHLFTWLSAGNFKANFGFFFDPLTAVMLCVVCGIGFLITVFAAGYMKGEEGYFRFFAYLGLFIFSMTCLVMGENFIMLYLGWEGVGLCSYLLIGYYYQKPSAREAAKKAFITNRVGDFGFGLGIMLTYVAFGTVSFFGDAQTPGVLVMPLEKLTHFQQSTLGVLPFLLMLGAFGKSAQFPLYVWLPDAMEGPTPVSALIHAATMVTAGVYMIARCSTLFVGNAAALLTIALVGAFTAIFAATIALRQFDLKKVFAYSTISQLGFMFVGMGVLAPVAGVFHLVTHAFFKALLFLSSGVVMHAMLGHLDMRKMSGLKSVLPKTNILILIGCLALAGVPPLAGFFSKDEIVIAAWDRNKILGLVMLLTALMTAYYTFRLYFRVFLGPEVVPTEPAENHAHDDHGHDAHGHASEHAPHNHEPLLMILPLVLLAIGALASGWFLAHDEALGHFLGFSPSFSLGYTLATACGRVDPAVWGQVSDIVEHGSSEHTSLMTISILIAGLGILLAYVNHLQNRAKGEALANRFPAVRILLEGKYFVDEIYQAAIIEPLRMLGKAFFWIDRWLVDGMVNTAGFIPQLGGFALKLTTQRGRLQGYALLMLAGVAAILLLIFI